MINFKKLFAAIKIAEIISPYDAAFDREARLRVNLR